MEQSLFLEEVKKYFPGLAAKVVTRLNDSTNPNAQSYLHRSMLRKEYSTNLKWESITVSGSSVMADVVALDSSLPLKRRDSISRANGDIPKMGMEMAIREKELTDLRILSDTPGRTTDFLARLFRDTERVITGIYERLEYEFLLGLSTGISIVTDTVNVGTGIRVDYGYLTANKFGVPVVWSNPASTPFNDITTRILNKASLDGKRINRILMDQATFNNVAKTTEAKEMYSFSIGYVGTNTPIPTLSQVNVASQDRFGFTIEIVDRSVRYEKNGVQTSVKPWAAGAVVALTAPQVGTLTYGQLAEQSFPVDNVNYSNVDDFILVSKFRLNRPSLAEFTNGQALVVPVINDVDAIYLIDSTLVQA